MKENSLSILALGDSYTIGEGVGENERWPHQLVNGLKRFGIQSEQPCIIAQTGWTSGELIQAIEERKISSGYDLVFLLIGVNNQYRSYPIEEYRKEFKQLLSMAINYAKEGCSKVYVLSIPDWGNTYFAEGKDKSKIALEIDAFNKVNKEESKNAKVNYIGITEITRQPINNSLLAADGLHPSGKMYAQWVDKLLLFLKS